MLRIFAQERLEVTVKNVRLSFSFDFTFSQSTNTKGEVERVHTSLFYILLYYCLHFIVQLPVTVVT